MAYAQGGDGRWLLSWNVVVSRGHGFPREAAKPYIEAALEKGGGWIGPSGAWVGGFGSGWSEAFALAVACADHEAFLGEGAAMNGVSDLKVSAIRASPQGRDWMVACSCVVDDGVKLMEAGRLASIRGGGTGVKPLSLEDAASRVGQSCAARPLGHAEAGVALGMLPQHGTGVELWLSAMEAEALSSLAADPAKPSRQATL